MSRVLIKRCLCAVLRQRDKLNLTLLCIRYGLGRQGWKNINILGLSMLKVVKKVRLWQLVYTKQFHWQVILITIRTWQIIGSINGLTFNLFEALTQCRKNHYQGYLLLLVLANPFTFWELLRVPTTSIQLEKTST
jgi:hypothetical protein